MDDASPLGFGAGLVERQKKLYMPGSSAAAAADAMFKFALPLTMLQQLDKEIAEDSLLDFASLMWPVLEPGRQMKRGWAVEAICEHLEALSRNEIQKCLINVPPGMMKSMLVSVFWPAWEWGPRKQPWLRYVNASYSQDLTIRDNRRGRQLIESGLYQQFWGDQFTISADQDAKVRYDNDKRGFRIATSVGGLSTGERGDRFVIDDPHNVKTAESEAKLDEIAQWLTEVVPSRVNDLNESKFLIIMQRVHERDASGVIMGAAEDLGYVHLELPMEFETDRRCHTVVKSKHHLPGETTFTDPRTVEGELVFPERFDRKGVEDLKKVLSTWGGQYAISGQLQQSPTPRGGGMFKKAACGDPVPLIEVPVGGEPIRGWDIAGSEKKKSPYTASCKIKKVGTTYYILDVTRERKEIEAAENHIVEVAHNDGFGVKQDLPQDPGSAGKSQKNQLGSRLEGLDYVFSPESGAKEDRAIPFASAWNNGLVKMVVGDWNKRFLAELGSFPRGMYKDQVDAASRAYNRFIRRKGSQNLGGSMAVPPAS